MRLILWLMYVTILAYNIMDYIHTLMALKLGIEEVNPILVYFIELLGTNHAIGMVKLVPTILLGVLLVVYSDYHSTKVN